MKMSSLLHRRRVKVRVRTKYGTNNSISGQDSKMVSVSKLYLSPLVRFFFKGFFMYIRLKQHPRLHGFINIHIKGS